MPSFNKNIATVDALEAQRKKDTVGKRNTKRRGSAEGAPAGRRCGVAKTA